jgi:beta-phosphoglucomutase-like phosphatase (HAD superfamily)
LRPTGEVEVCSSALTTGFDFSVARSKDGVVYGVIFDLDGLLADTEPLHCSAYIETLREVGFELTEAAYEDHWIRRGLGILDWCSQHSLPVDPIVLRERKNELYAELVRSSVQAMPGAHSLVALLRPYFPLAVGTSTFRDGAQLVLDCIGLDFPVIATLSDGARPKPAPDIFLEAARGLRVPASKCIVIEDAEKGIVAATAAGMLSIAVPNRHTQYHDFSGAALCVESLERLSVQDFLQLIAVS